MVERWSGIWIGTVVSLGLMLMLALSAVGTGLLVFPFESNDDAALGIGLGVGTFLALSTFASYFVGGMLASRLHRPQQKGEICFQGLAVWGTSTCAVALVVAALMTSGLKSAGNNAGALAMMDSIQRLHPRIVTDMSIIKGKAVSTFTLDEEAKHPDQMIKREAKALHTKEVVETARKGTAAFSLASFFALLISLVASALGAWVGRPGPATAPSRQLMSRTEAA